MLSQLAIRVFVPLALSVAAAASQISYTVNTATTTLPFTSLTATVPQFDPALGSLQALRLDCHTYIQGNLGFENQASSPVPPHQVFFQAGCQASGPGVSGFNVSGDSPWTVPALGAYDGTLDYAGTSGTTITLPLMHAGHGFWDWFPLSLDAWTGTGSVTVTAANGFFGLTSNGKAWSQSLSVFVEFTVTYTYTTAPNMFCSGAWSPSCPCTPAPPALGGCPNSAAPGGARLVPSSSSSLGNDTFTLTASDMPPSTSVLFFQGTAHSNSGFTFGEGSRCVLGTIRRLGTKVAVSGVAQYPAPGDAPISIQGQIPGPGAQRAYQAWYRDPADFCTPATFNLTSGVRTTWTL